MTKNLFEINRPLEFDNTDNGGIIHVTNIKGGVGKSTIATNLAAILSRRGPTLIVDLDVQGSATHAFGMDPSEFGVSSWELLSRRFSEGNFSEWTDNNYAQKINAFLTKVKSIFLAQVVGKDRVTSLVVKINSCLDIIPATTDLFKNVRFYHLQNLIHNLQLCRNYYKYIIIDTPSVWNKLIKTLFITCDLNLIPVTLNALSTRSLSGYLRQIKRLTKKKTDVRVRIIKNGVFGKAGSKIKGKTRTMKENRKILMSLCEQISISNNSGVSLLPQPIIFDLEIPESSSIYNAQDAGIPIYNYHQYSSVAKALENLAKHIQYVLNNPIIEIPKKGLQTIQGRFSFGFKAVAALIFISVFTINAPVSDIKIADPIAPQQIAVSEEKIITHTFVRGETMARLAKYAICRLKAVVPSKKEINKYILETIKIHNLTSKADGEKIKTCFNIPSGTVVKFYQPSNIKNKNADKLIPVFEYFTSIVDDPYAYITGDWCERGSGGGTPHYGIDVAAPLGTRIRSPIDGVAALRDSREAGRMIGVRSDGMVIFFAHCNKRYFNTGDRVKKGDVVGTIGTTGVVTGPHVHVGYGLETPSRVGIRMGNHYYKLTDPKLFFFKQVYMSK